CARSDDGYPFDYW
nr:immunoglobulin heavy chain junction region [Mus musculus]